MTAHAWRERERPLRLERRIEFPDYESLRTALDAIAALSEQTGLYPNQSFGRDYANLTLFADEASGTLTDEIRAFARQVDELISNPVSQPASQPMTKSAEDPA